MAPPRVPVGPLAVELRGEDLERVVLKRLGFDFGEAAYCRLGGGKVQLVLEEPNEVGADLGAEDRPETLERRSTDPAAEGVYPAPVHRQVGLSREAKLEPGVFHDQEQLADRVHLGPERPGFGDRSVRAARVVLVRLRLGHGQHAADRLQFGEGVRGQPAEFSILAEVTLKGKPRLGRLNEAGVLVGRRRGPTALDGRE